MDRFVFEKSVYDLQIVHYTEFDQFFTIKVALTFCVFADDFGRVVVKFHFRFGIEISTDDCGFSGLTMKALSMKSVEVTGCFRILQGDFKGRCVFTDNVGYDVIVWLNFHCVDSFGDWCDSDIWIWSYYYTSSRNWPVFMTRELRMQFFPDEDSN